MSASLDTLLQQRILVLDGAMGTMIQQRKLDEAAFRGERFKEWKKDLRGHNDLLNLTQPAVIEEIHRQYFEAGADIVEFNPAQDHTQITATVAAKMLKDRAEAEAGMEARHVVRAVQRIFNYRFNERARHRDPLRDPVEVLPPAQRQHCPASLAESFRSLTAPLADPDSPLAIDPRGHALGNLILTAAIFEAATRDLALATDKLLRKHGKKIVDAQLPTRRLADTMIDLFALGAVLARVSTKIEDHGEAAAAVEKEILRAFAAQARRRIEASLAALEENEDASVEALANHVLEVGKYPFDNL